MERSSRLPRTPSRLPDSLHHQLNMYALAASAAGVGALALSQPAEAKIIYTKTYRVIEYHQHYGIDLNHDKVTDFKVWNTSACISYFGCAQTIFEIAARGNGAIGYIKYRLSGGFASALKKGSPIGRGGDFLTAPHMAGLWSSGGGGPWYNVEDRYLGVKFLINGNTHYGWVRMSVTGKYPDGTVTLTGYAYETIPNKAIIAGKTKGPDVTIAQRDTLGGLALGKK